MKFYDYAAPMIFSIVLLVLMGAGSLLIVGAGSLLIYGGEPTQKADDTFYDRGLANMMRIAGLPDDEIKYLMSLPTSPEVDLDSIALQDTTRWFFVTPDLEVGIVFEINGQCKVPGFKVYDLRGRKGK